MKQLPTLFYELTFLDLIARIAEVRANHVTGSKLLLQQQRIVSKDCGMLSFQYSSQPF
jgi:hypothetical protein